ncbi:MAG TPA: endo alpha-1,4 polygalactosaminidase [Myxococcota bacterium]|nr:endo alpha-1,4 polygalactosaminidase [Myxococcota bacterium]HRY97102.1 endo alpha-1,4 polygalactosaminidase [Myxococcota bacterium]HSA23157.1 endo alpha-1,4 polygalactosaminidase [Myxococcota bacterium]
MSKLVWCGCLAAWALAGCSAGDGGGQDAGLDGLAQDAADGGEDGAAPDGEDAVGADEAGGDGSDPGQAIWRPAPGTSWQWQLGQPIDTSVDVEMYDVDLFETPQATIDALHAAGRIVICYYSAGSREDWRDDADQFPPEDVGDELDGWPGENWVRVSSAAVRAIMTARMDLAVEKRCDGVEPDNVDGWDNQNGLGITPEQQLDYNRFLARESHARGLSVGLKNDLAQIPALLADFDWALNEECVHYAECGDVQPFIAAGKAVFHVEYTDQEADGQALADQVCADASRAGFSTLIKTWELTAWRLACP